MMQIKALVDFADAEITAILEKIREIFFLSSSRTQFVTPQEKTEFLERWAGYYLHDQRDEVLILLSEGAVSGYLTGCRDSELAREWYRTRLGSYEVFADQFRQFPAHLHINLHPESRGQGGGSLLIEHYIQLLNARQIGGVHLVTSPGARNIAFYQRLGFQHSLERTWKNYPLLFLGHLINKLNK